MLSIKEEFAADEIAFQAIDAMGYSELQPWSRMRFGAITKIKNSSGIDPLSRPESNPARGDIMRGNLDSFIGIDIVAQFHPQNTLEAALLTFTGVLVWTPDMRHHREKPLDLLAAFRIPD